MLRPSFVRTQISDVEMFEKHVEHLIHAIPKDGATVNLQDLFFQLSLDVSTDLLFGESTNTLAPDFADIEVTAFMNAYVYCLRKLDGSGITENETGVAWGLLRSFLPNSKFKQQVRVVNSMLIHLFKAGLEIFKQRWI